ncbi:MAG TPA: hypothetical protein VK053_12510 [Jiangellaceae bacterium]|nr:hypothetical protein [Jiangellaceae bacterium]
MRQPIRTRPLRVATDLLVTSRWTLVSFIAIVVVLFTGIGLILIVTGTHAEQDGSVWEQASHAVRYFPLAIGIMIPTAFMLTELSLGVTRRDFAIGASAFALVVGLVMAALMAGGLLVEGPIFDAIGLEHGFNMNHVAERPDQVELVLLEYTIAVTAHVLTGWLIGVTYWHTGGVTGTILLPLTVLPGVLVDGTFNTGWVSGVMEAWEVPALPTGLGVVVAAAVTLVTAFINYLLIRRVGV